VPDQVGSSGFRVRPKLVDKFHIPKVVQIAQPESRCRHALVVAAAIVIVRSVQRLMHVADKVQQEYDGNPL